MLARRFTIVCLLMSLFGMYFATLVAETSRSHRSRENGPRLPCDGKIICRPVNLN